VSAKTSKVQEVSEVSPIQIHSTITLLYFFSYTIKYESPYGQDALQITHFIAPTYQVPHHHFKRNVKNKNEHKHTKSK
jgi:hypothetical protein